MTHFNDAQAGLGFVVSQTSHVEAQVYRIQFTQIQYQDLVPVDFSAHPWAKTVTYYSSESVGKAKWVNGNADDIPYGTSERTKFETSVHMAARGYQYGLEEVNQASMLGVSLDSEGAISARRSYEEFVDALALSGDTSKGYEGLFNYSSVPTVTAANNAAGSSALWANKTADEALKDVNDALTGVQVGTNNVAMADTVLMPYERFNTLASTRLANTTMTSLEFIRQNNVYTATYGKPLEIRGVRGLLTAGAGSTARMIAYHKDPQVLKLHVPSPLKFLPVQIEGLQYRIPGYFRVGGLDIRLPKEVRYVDGI